MFNTDDMNLTRVLAVVALVICGIAFLGVVIGSSVGGESSSNSDESTQTEKAGSGKREKAGAGDRSAPRRSTYTVRSGDSLGSIAVKVNVPVEKLQQLNPDLDPQALVSGQKIKLRE